MVNKSDIQLVFSELKWIKNKDLRDKVVDVWGEGAKRDGWKNLDKVPFTLLLENCGKLTDHTKRVTKLAKNILDIREENLNGDFLIADTLLHDVGKPLEYEITNDKIVKSEYGKKFRHPVSGAMLAKELYLPDGIVHIIFAHSHEGDKTDRSPESYIVHHCDFIDFHNKKSMVNK